MKIKITYEYKRSHHPFPYWASIAEPSVLACCGDSFEEARTRLLEKLAIPIPDIPPDEIIEV